MNARAPGYPLLKVAIRFEPDIVTARQRTRHLSQVLGFESQDQVRLATAVSELARNVFQYAGTGSIEFFFAETTPQTLFVRVSDNGPGIQHLKDVLGGTYRSKSGMGVGLIGTKKLMDHFQIECTASKGTVVTIGKALERRAKPVTRDDLDSVVDKLVARPAESPFEEIQNQNRDLLLALDQVNAAKEELADLNAELRETNRGIVALYAELDEKAASLLRANELKTGFLSNMTHEFRTPLSSVISLTRILLNRFDGELTQEQEKQVNYIREASEGLLELVNDLLDLAKVEAGKVSVNAAPFSAEELLSGLRGMFRPIMMNNAVELIVDLAGSGFDLHTDQAKLGQILRNLVSNSVKFTEQGTITVKAALDTNDLVRFSVTDTGIGVDPAFAEAIFDDFSQIESPLQRQQKGTGLGLPLSRKLARLLGGDLWFETRVGQGSAFHFVVPRVYTGGQDGVLFANKSSAVAPVPETPAAGAAHRFRVLVIDDDEPSRYVLKTLVSRQFDAQFDEASNGKLGLERIRSWDPDLVFLDLSMPELDGLEVLRSVRAIDGRIDLPIIINTARKLSPEEKQLLEQEATAVLSKERNDESRAFIELQAALAKAGFDYQGLEKR